MRLVCRSHSAVLATLLALLSSLAASAQDLDSLNEDLRVETARLAYALEKIQRIGYPLGTDDRRSARALLRDGRFLMKQAATTSPRDVERIREVIGQLQAARVEADTFLEHVAPAWDQQVDPEGPRTYRSPYMEVIKYRDVAEDTWRGRDTLTAEERERARELIVQGDELVLDIKAVRESDHEAREERVSHLMQIRQELQALDRLDQEPRTRGYPFLSLRRARVPWTPLEHAENGFRALRTRFIEPGSAYVTVENATDEMRHLFVEMEFFTEAGDRTGHGVFETAELQELLPGEVREVLVPVYRDHPRFWQVTRSFTIYLD